MAMPIVLPPSPPTSSSRTQSQPVPATKHTTNTPNDSPASDPEQSSSGSRKKVEFAPWTAVHQPNGPLTSSILSTQVKPLPPSRECSSSGKSILKATGYEEAANFGFDGTADEQLSLSETMDSIVQQLARNDNIQSIDAYQTLASLIKAYGEIPEEATFKTKLSSITKHIKHDLSSKQKADAEPSALNLVISALKLAVILVWNQEFSELLNDEFRVFLLEKAIHVISEHKASKTILMHYLHLLATQEFRPTLLTANNRASRLLDALRALTDHVKGNGVVSERLLVYQRLLDQARPVMKTKASSWVDLMLSASVSSLPDTRNKALALGRKACQAFPVSTSISTSIRIALDMKHESGRTLGSSICRRLDKLVTSKDDAAQVPQIWAVIILLCNSPSTKIDSWSSLREWLMVIQRCFNSSDSMLRQQAHLAWNRFVYVARPHEASDSLASMLAKPIVAQFDRITTDKAPKTTQAAAVSSYCNLLYYSFRPAINQSQYTRAWNEYVVKVMRSSFFEKHPANPDIAARCLMSLFWDAKTTTKVWNENRAHEIRTIEPEELPTVDPKWTRSRSQHVLQIFQVLFKHGCWGLPGASEQAFVSKAWRHFLKAVQEAGSKEIKMSNDSRTASENILKFVSDLWFQSGTSDSPEGPPRTRLSKDVLSSITRTAICEIGVFRVSETLDANPLSLHPMVFTAIFDVLKDSATSQAKSANNITTVISKMGRCFDLALIDSYKSAMGSTSNFPTLVVESISQILSSLPEMWLVFLLFSLGEGFAKWIRDEKRVIPSKSNDHTDNAFGMLARLARCTTSVLSKIQPAMVEELDLIFAAAFASTHKTIVNATVQTWNLYFGSSSDLQIGLSLGEVFEELRPYVEIDLPVRGLATAEYAETGLLPAYETQDLDNSQPLDLPVGFDNQQEVVREGHGDSHTTRAAGNKQSVPVTTHVQPQREHRKLRHEDSQIDFVAIQSSPPGEVEDTQMMTDHQKEVRDHRREEPAVTFPDLHSSPRPQSKRSKTPDCSIARKAAASVERPSTPTLPDHGDVDDGVQPSPTPKSKLARNVKETEVPSSPLAQEAVEQIEHLSSPPTDNTVHIAQAVNLALLIAAAEGDHEAQELDMDEQVQNAEAKFVAEQLQDACSERYGHRASPSSQLLHAERYDSEDEDAELEREATRTDLEHNQASSVVDATQTERDIAPVTNILDAGRGSSLQAPSSTGVEEMTADQLSEGHEQWLGVFDDLIQTPDPSPQKNEVVPVLTNHEAQISSIVERENVMESSEELEQIRDRKRKRSPQHDDEVSENKRLRAVAPTLSPLSASSPAHPRIKQEDPEEVLEEIEAAYDTASSPSVQPEEDEDSDEQPMGRLADNSSQTSVGPDPLSSSPKIHSAIGRLLQQITGKQPVVSSPTNERSSPLPQSDGSAELSSAMHGSSPPPHVDGLDDPHRSIESSLHNILGQLRLANKDDFDLRHVDDLLFQIRCEVHAAAQREP